MLSHRLLMTPRGSQANDERLLPAQWAPSANPADEPLGGLGWETRECDFDVETRRRRDRRREATRRRERARRQRRNVAFGSARSGYRRENQKTGWPEGTGFTGLAGAAGRGNGARRKYAVA